MSLALKIQMNDVERLFSFNECTESMQNVRLSLLKGKKCLWITNPLITRMGNMLKSRVEWLLSVDVEIIPVYNSKSDKLIPIMEELHVGKKYFIVDLFSDNVAENIFDVLKKDELKIDVIFSPYEQCQPLVGALNSLMNIPGNSSDSYITARSKSLTRKACEVAKLPTPRNKVVKNLDELESCIEHVNFPCIIKPESGAGSASVYKISNMQEAKNAYDEIIKSFEKDDNIKWNPVMPVNHILLEEFLEGPEFDIDILLWEKKAVYAQVVDNWPCISPYFLETGSNMPSTFSNEILKSLEKFGYNCVIACGFTRGCFHVECVYTQDGPRLIEVNPRQGGGSMQIFNSEIYGVDIFANFFISACNIPINPPRSSATHGMADYSITCPKTGILMDTNFIDEIKLHPKVISAISYYQAGDQVTGIDTQIPVWLGDFIVKDDDVESAKRTVNEIIKKITINVQKVSD